VRGIRKRIGLNKPFGFRRASPSDSLAEQAIETTVNTTL
jgi:hypothetical protein